MSAIFLLFIIIGLAAIVLGIGYLRIRAPHSRGMALEQAKIDRKKGLITPQPVTVNGDSKRFEWLRGKIAPRFWLVLIGIASIVGLYELYDKNITIAEVTDWARGHWFFILILWSVLATAIAFNPKMDDRGKKEARTTPQWILAGIVVMLFVGLPFIERITRTTNSGHPTERPILTMPAYGDSAHVNGPIGYAVTFFGKDFTTHCVYTDGHEGIVGDALKPCEDGPMLYQYVHDTSGRPNSVTYEFVRPQ